MKYLSILIFLILPMSILAQSETLPESKKDNSNPTNVYSQIDNFLEYTKASDYYSLAYNPKISYTPNEDHLLLLEVPFRYISNVACFTEGCLRAVFIP